ncbi:group II intron, maturase, partial [Pseudomonas syringae pv. actinidiae ICMP 19096]
MHQMPGKPGRDAIAEGEAPRKASSDEAGCPRHDSTPTGSGLLQAALTRDNLQLAFKQVRANKGAAGVDG